MDRGVGDGRDSLQNYNEFLKQYFERENRDFVTFLIQELDLGYQSRILQLGSGAGWLSLELARRLPEASIVGLESDQALVQMASQNLKHMKLANLRFMCGELDQLDIFPNRSFDAVISNQQLHRWKSPQRIFNEFNRLLEKGGKYAIGDTRRDLKALAKLVIWFRSLTMPGAFRASWRSDLAGSYTVSEVVQLLLQTKLKDWKIRSSLFDLLIYKP
ncbi:MAG: class I SAM-dependent methyltransferase [Candidatus Zhuqueibacterota bacterium]